MIDSMHGTVHNVLPGSFTLRVNGIGYRVVTPMELTNQLRGDGEPASFLVHEHFNVNTGEKTLFGFEDDYQRGMFRALLKVKKIGPSTAMKVLVAIEARELAALIRDGDAARLQAIRGLGKKSAEQAIVELRDKLDDFVDPRAAMTFSPIKAAAVDALVNLGAKRSDAVKQVDRALKDHASVDHGGARVTVQNIVKQALGA